MCLLAIGLQHVPSLTCNLVYWICSFILQSGAQILKFLANMNGEVCSSDASILTYCTTWYHNSGDRIMNIRHRRNLEFHLRFILRGGIFRIMSEFEQLPWTFLTIGSLLWRKNTGLKCVISDSFRIHTCLTFIIMFLTLSAMRCITSALESRPLTL